MKNNDRAYWDEIMRLAETHNIIIDRPNGQIHPRYSDIVYPLDYGYFENTSASDGGGIDVWIGSLEKKILTGILCTFDTLKRDPEEHRDDVRRSKYFWAAPHRTWISFSNSTARPRKTLYIQNPEA